MSRILAAAAAIVMLAGVAPAQAKCSDEIKALQGKAQGADAANNPGEQKQTSDPQTNAPGGGGTKSASEKVLEAQAFDQKGDEANCMKAVEAAKAATDQK